MSDTAAHDILMAARREYGDAVEKREEAWRNYINACDLNSEGKITRQELMQVLETARTEDHKAAVMYRKMNEAYGVFFAGEKSNG